MRIRLNIRDTEPRLTLSAEQPPRLSVHGDFVGGALPEYEGTYSVAPTESAQTLETGGCAMAADVSVSAIPSDYVGSAIARRDSGDLTASGVTVTVPSGYYAESASKATAPALQSKSVSYTPTESAQGGTVTADAGYYGLSAVTVSVGAIPYADGDGMGYGS